MPSWVLLFSAARLSAEQAGHPLQSHVLKLGKPLGKGQAAAMGAWSIPKSWYCHAPPLQTPHLVPPSLAGKDCVAIQGPPFQGCPSWLLLKFILCLATQGWRGHPCQAELPLCPERQGRGDSSGMTALAARLGTCLHGRAHPGDVYRQAGAPVHKK